MSAAIARCDAEIAAYIAILMCDEPCKLGEYEGHYAQLLAYQQERKLIEAEEAAWSQK
jgi:hypothetical protein